MGDYVWKEDEIILSQDVKYGSAFNNATGKEEDLLLDVYLPPESDKRTLRPAAVLVHGGAFVVGNKKVCTKQAMDLVRRGIVAVSINYRLNTGPKSVNMSVSEAPVLAAVEDARAAVRYLRKVATEYRIDS